MHAIYDGCGSLVTGPLADGRSIPDGWSNSSVQPEHPFASWLDVRSVRLGLEAGDVPRL